jgi:ParB family chromosome partitioning protein
MWTYVGRFWSMFKKGLGRGLDALIPGGLAAEAYPVLGVEPGEIDPNPYQPRLDVSDESVADLAESVKRHGMIQPLLVRRKGERYELVAGERRWRAARLAGMETVPCIVRDVPDDRVLQLALIENLQREDLTPIEAARGYERLITEFNLTQTELAEALGRSRVAITNALRLLTLPPEVQDSLHRGAITEGHARALVTLQDQEKALIETWQQIVAKGMSVRDAERLAQARSALAKAQKARRGMPWLGRGKRTVDPHVAESIERLQTALGTRVRILRESSGAGTIVIRFYSTEDMGRVVDAITGREQWSK